MRLSRPCWDKPHRCPGWAGGGWKSGNDRHYCPNGTIRTFVKVPNALVGEDPRWFNHFEHPSSDKGRWRFGFCSQCDVRTIPWALRKLDPRWWMIYKYRLANKFYFWRTGAVSRMMRRPDVPDDAPRLREAMQDVPDLPHRKADKETS